MALCAKVDFAFSCDVVRRLAPRPSGSSAELEFPIESGTAPYMEPGRVELPSGKFNPTFLPEYWCRAPDLNQDASHGGAGLQPAGLPIHPTRLRLGERPNPNIYSGITEIPPP